MGIRNTNTGWVIRRYCNASPNADDTHVLITTLTFMDERCNVVLNSLEICNVLNTLHLVAVANSSVLSDVIIVCTL